MYRAIICLLAVFLKFALLHSTAVAVLFGFHNYFSAQREHACSTDFQTSDNITKPQECLITVAILTLGSRVCRTNHCSARLGTVLFVPYSNLLLTVLLDIHTIIYTCVCVHVCTYIYILEMTRNNSALK